jgi:peptidoglycan/LPS O-acetylase OafA/YrhL
MDGNRRRRLGSIPALDGIRGVSILLVVFFHAYQRPLGGALGVRVFFVLSGFLITTLLLQEERRLGAIGLRRFYLRRSLRLLPALGVVVIAYAVVTMAVVYGASPYLTLNLAASRDGILVGVLYLSNVFEAWHGGLPSAIGHLWSLAAEEQFYILWPPALVLLLRRRASPRTLARLLGTGIAAIAIGRPVLAALGMGQRHIDFSPETTFDALLVGCLFGVWFVHDSGPKLLRSRRVRSAILPFALAFGALYLLVPQIAWRAQTSASAWLVLFELVCALVILSAVLDGGGLLSRVLALRPLVGLGRISYGLYLWHPLVFFSTGYFRTKPLALAVSLTLALLSYRFVELPFLRRKAQLAEHSPERAPALPAPAPA